MPPATTALAMAVPMAVFLRLIRMMLSLLRGVVVAGASGALR